MRRTTTLTAASLLGLTLLVPTVAAQAAGETCRGEAATIVGSGPTLTGTEGRDVIVTGPARDVDALGGDDVVCVTPTMTDTNVVEVDAGTGDDTVDTTAASDRYRVIAVLGAGADSFAGGAAYDVVHAGDRTAVASSTQDAAQVDTERDTVDTGDSADYVLSGSAGAVNHDVVRLGAGRDTVDLPTADVAPDAVLDGGPDADTLTLAAGEHDLGLDMALGVFASGRGTAGFASFESAAVRTGSARFTYRGTPGDDALTVTTDGGTPTLDVATAGGDDEITFRGATPAAAVAAGSRIDGGEGRNALVAAFRAGKVSLHLGRGRLEVDGRSSTVSGLRDAVLMAPEVTMVGDRRGNDLSFVGCRGRLRGGGGADRLESTRDSRFELYDYGCRAEVVASGGSGADRIFGGEAGDRLRGGRDNDTIEGRRGSDRVWGDAGRDRVDAADGNDRVWGGSGRDVLRGEAGRDALVGGTGRDTVDGAGGRDRCVAERERRCER